MGNSALIIAHPGHEMCVYGWIAAERPDVFILTDGSGRSGTSRLHSTTEILSSVKAEPGSLYGRFTDRNIYTAILNQDFDLFRQLVTELAEAIITRAYEQVVGDAAEGYNPVHDVCRLVTNAAVEIAGRLSDRKIINRDFLLFGRHQEALSRPRANDVLRLELSDSVFARKVEVARNYRELKPEVDAALAGKIPLAPNALSELKLDVGAVDAMGGEAYRVEYLRQVKTQRDQNGDAENIPFYERYGELLVSAGYYQEPIRYRQNFLPLAEAIHTFVDRTLSV